jgi:hypothetical protein
MPLHDVKDKGKEKFRDHYGFEEQALYGGRFEGAHGNAVPRQAQQPELLFPKPIRLMQKKVNAQSANTAYNTNDTEAALVWDNFDSYNLAKPASTQGEVSAEVVDYAQTTDGDLGSLHVAVVEQDLSLDDATSHWRESNRPATSLPKRSYRQNSVSSSTTVKVANHKSVDCQKSNMDSKRSIICELEKPKQTESSSRVADTRRKMEEAKRKRAEREKQEEEQRSKGEQENVEGENRLWDAEQRQFVEKEQQEETVCAQTSAPWDANNDRTSIPLEREFNQGSSNEDLETRQRSFEKVKGNGSMERQNSGASSKKVKKRKNIGRTDTFSESTTRISDMYVGVDSGTNFNTRSMSMNDQIRPDFSKQMPSIAEDGNFGKCITHEKVEPARFSSTNTRKSKRFPTQAPRFSLHSRDLNDRTESQDAPSTLYASSDDSKRSSQSSKYSRTSSDAMAQAPIMQYSENPRNRQSSKDFSIAQPAGNVSKVSLETRDSKRPKPPEATRNSSTTTKTLSKLGRKSSSSSRNFDQPDRTGLEKVQKVRNSAISAEPWRQDDAPQLRSGGILTVEPESE